MKVAIVTTSHWEGDPRLNRHKRYLEDSGHQVEFAVATASGSKLRSLLRGIVRIIRGDAGVVILPDPELFVPGALAARLTGKKPVIDIHEDYAKTAAERSWIPGVLRPVVALAARLVVAVGRSLAWRAVVAAPQLARRGDALVTNVPDPADFDVHEGTKSQVVYVGEVFAARGTTEMVKLLAELPEGLRLLVIGKVSEETRDEMLALAEELGVADRLELTGRLPHSEAWERAAGSVAGLALLQPAPAYLDAIATKVWEYMTAGIPPVVSDLPGQAGVVKRIDSDLVCSSPKEAAEVIIRLASQPTFRQQVVARGRAVVEEQWERNRPDLAIQESVSP